MFYTLSACLAIALAGYAAARIILSEATGMAKLAWVAGVLLVPFLGFVIWYVAGPKPTPKRTVSELYSSQFYRNT